MSYRNDGDEADVTRKKPPVMSPLADESANAPELLLAASPPTASPPTASPPDSPVEYVPRPYMFLIENEEVMPENTCLARTPPYWLLVDHTIAVIYCMCSPKLSQTASLGISQLSWALEFLKTVKSRRGNYHKDIKLLIGNIEDRILECYVAIGHKAGQDKGADSTWTTSKRNKSQMSPDDSKRSQLKAPSRTSSRLETKVAEPEKKPQKATSMDEQDYADFEAGLMESKARGSKTSMASRPRVNYTDGANAGNESQAKDNDEVVRFYETLKSSDGRRVLSVTYEEVVARAPAVHETPQRSRDRRRRNKRNNDEDDSDLETSLMRKLTDSSKLDSTISRQNLMAFFAGWRQEQVDRLQVEMQRLSNIEEFMAKIDDSFDRVLDEDVAKQLKEYKTPSEGQKQRKPASDTARFNKTK